MQHIEEGLRWRGASVTVHARAIWWNGVFGGNGRMGGPLNSSAGAPGAFIGVMPDLHTLTANEFV